MCLIFPSLTKQGNPITSREELLEKAKAFLIGLNGGATTRTIFRSPAQGGCVIDGQTVEEYVDELRSWSDVLDERKMRAFLQYAKYLVKSLEQDSIAVELDGIMYLVK